MAKRSTKKTFKRRVVRRKSIKRKGSLKRMVKKLIQKSAEKKRSNVVGTGLNVYTSANVSGCDGVVQQISPGTGSFQIQQGTGQADRIGNRIKIVRCTLKGSMDPKPYSSVSNAIPLPVVVQLFVFYDKDNTTIYPAPVSAGDFFQFGNTATTFRNDPVDGWAPVNSDRYVVVLRKKWKLGYASYMGTGTTVGAQGYANNDFKLNHEFKFDLTKHLVKNVRYDDNATDPTTRGLWFVFIAYGADGTAMPSQYIPANVQYSQDLIYTDI